MNIKSIGLLYIALLVCNKGLSNEYFVSINGADSNDGSTLSTAFKTIQYGVDNIGDGDILWVDDGVYNEEITITNSGIEGYWITIKAINKHEAKIRSVYSNCFTIDANYIEIDGFDLVSTNTYGSGVGTKQGRHHITARNCYAHDCGQSGLASYDNDYITFESNICCRNAWLMPYAGSGISVYGGYNSDNSNGIHNYVCFNICFDNDNGPETAMTDGNGIIIDDLKCTQSGHDFDICSLNGYNEVETIVEGNLCFDNGGKGIQVYLTENVTIRNNTCYQNNKRDSEGTWRGEISFSNSDNLRIINNIAVSNSDMGFDLSSYNTAYLIAQYGSHTTGDVVFSNNLSYDIANPSKTSFDNQVGSSNVEQTDNLLATDPLFTEASIDSLNADFSLQELSPAIDKGTLAFGVADHDLRGDARVMRTGIDLGCYEVKGDTLNVAVHYSKINKSLLSIFPNPSNDIINISFYLPVQKHYKAEIIDYSGKSFKKLALSSNVVNPLNVNELHAGFYLLEVHIENQQYLFQPFIKL